MDGFFPHVFKDEFPEGVKLDLDDRRESVCDKNGEQETIFSGKGEQCGAEKKKKLHGLASIGESDMPMKKDDFLMKLPEKVIGESGNVIDIRGGIEVLLNNKKDNNDGIEETGKGVRLGSNGETTHGCGDDDYNEKRGAAYKAAEMRRMRGDVEVVGVEDVVVVEDAVVIVEEEEEEEEIQVETVSQLSTLRVRIDCGQSNSKTCVLKMKYNATIGMLRREIETNLDGTGTGKATELRTSYPNRAFGAEEDGVSLLEAGLAPNGTLIYRFCTL